MRLPAYRRTSWRCLVAALIVSACGEDELEPPDAHVVAIAVEDSFAVSIDDRILTRVLVYNATQAPVTIPRCQVESAYPDSDGLSMAMGFQIYRLYDNGDWGVYGNAQVPRCITNAIPELATVVQPGEVAEAQTLVVPHEPGRYSWIVGYTTDTVSGCCQSAGTPIVTVVVR